MRLSTETKKLGKGVHTFSREVGPTCPPTCPFLTGTLPDGSIIRPGHRCYANRIQKRRPSVRLGWSKQNDAKALDGLGVQLVDKDVRSLRIHVGGDFGNPDAPGTIDRDYLDTLTKEIWTARILGWKGNAWLYTHFWRSIDPYPLQTVGIAVYASVHTEAEATEAARLGYLLAVDMGEAKPTSGRKALWGTSVLSCPEQVKGHAVVTCTSCQYCSKGKGNVGFYRHS